jgi:hypothetical protein
LGVPTDPKTLNSDLKRKNGFTDLGLLKWNIAEMVASNTIVFELLNKPSYVAIDTAIQSGCPVITIPGQTLKKSPKGKGADCLRG